MNFSVGLDWASQAHAVCVIDGTGRVRWKESVEHSTSTFIITRRFVS